MIVIGVAASLLLHLVAMQAPWLGDTLRLAPLDSVLLGPILFGAAALLAVTEAYKLVRRIGD